MAVIDVRNSPGVKVEVNRPEAAIKPKSGRKVYRYSKRLKKCVEVE